MNQLLFFVNSIALGVGLAMDAFSVSLANGLKEPGMNKKRMLLIAGVFAVFQCVMPLLGYLFVHTAAEIFTFLLPVIPWIALLLLLWIGGKMLREGVEEFRSAGQKTVPENDESAAPSVAQTKAPAESVSEAAALPKNHTTASVGGPGFRELMIQGVATSIDALSVGFTIVEYQLLSAVSAASIIGIITLVICLAGLRLGKLFGLRLSRYAAILGGVILIAIGLEIWIKGVFLG